MYVPTTFNRILKLLNKNSIDHIIKSNKSDKHSKGFNTWSHLAALLFAQLSSSKSLRDLIIGFNAKSQIHYHCGIVGVRKSTLADANKNRTSSVFKDIAHNLMHCGNKEARELIDIFDSTVITVSGRGSQWTRDTQIVAGQGLKVHVQYGPENGKIMDIQIGATNVNDITAAQTFGLSEGKIYVYDKGYCDFNWWHKIHSAGAYFVTRIKSNAKYKVISSKEIEPEEKQTILSDCVVTLCNKNPRGGKINLLADTQLRLVTAINPEDNKQYTFISNLLTAKARDIAAYYKERWSIELLFKWLKQNLKLTKFLGESENAIRIQIYVAIIAYILIGMFKELYSKAFGRTIDYLYWIKATLTSAVAIVNPPGNSTSTKLAKTDLNTARLA